MSIQSTIEITKEKAIEKATDILVKKMRDISKGVFPHMPDKEIEDYIEEKLYRYKIIE